MSWAKDLLAALPSRRGDRWVRWNGDIIWLQVDCNGAIGSAAIKGSVNWSYEHIGDRVYVFDGSGRAMAQ